MEANLNQFRLLTVTGEERAGNERRRSVSSRELARLKGYFDPLCLSADFNQPKQVINKKDTIERRHTLDSDVCIGGNTEDIMSTKTKSEDSNCSKLNGEDGYETPREFNPELKYGTYRSSPRQSIICLPTVITTKADKEGKEAVRRSSSISSEDISGKHGDHLPSLSPQMTPGPINMDGLSLLSPIGTIPSFMNEFAEDDSLKEELEECTTSERCLIRALRSLERTVQHNNFLINRKLKRERTLKQPDRTTEPVIQKNAAIRHDKVHVYIRVVFLKIGEIDTMKENFMADAFIQARWREPTFDGQSSQFQCLQNIDDIDWDRFWNPKIYVENNLGEPKETVWQTLLFNAAGEATIYERRRIKGCFLENLELDEFPFDTQDLTLTVSTERSEMELELEEDSSEISSINVQSFVDEQEWKLHSHVETRRRVTTKIYQNSRFKHPALSASCRASRRPGFFIWNIFLVMLFICSLTFATFSVEYTKPENRLQLSFILLLTTITFKFVVSQTLPRISYLTYLDKYILTSMGILCGVCVWHAVIPQLKADDQLARQIDMWALILSCSSYFLFHVFFFLYIYFVAMRKRWKYDQKDRDHRERVKKLQRLQEINAAANNSVMPIETEFKRTESEPV